MAAEETARTQAANVGALVDLGASRHGDLAAIRFRAGDDWEERSYVELRDAVRDLALGLIELGVAPGERVCVLANTRPEWTQLAYAIWSAGAVVVPIYPTNSPEECEWVAGNSGASVVICEDESQLEKIRAVRQNLPELRELVLIDGEAGDARPLSAIAGGADGADGADAGELERRTAAVTPDDPLLIIYTSGTTGPPKGCVLT